MFTSNTTQEFRQTLNEFAKVSQENYDGYAYSSGYFETLAGQLFGYMTKRQQAVFQKSMEGELMRMKSELAQKHLTTV